MFANTNPGLVFTKLLKNILLSFRRHGCLNYKRQLTNVLITLLTMHHQGNNDRKNIVRSFANTNPGLVVTKLFTTIL
jgi:hypothetical protein